MDSSQFASAKVTLRKQMKALEDELNRYLASDYGVKVSDKAAYAQWLRTHAPFHWFIEFYGILSGRGFDVAIGNPPYIEYTKVKEDYRVQPHAYGCFDCGNVYSFVIERCCSLLRHGGRTGMIVQLSAICTDRMENLQRLFQKCCDRLWASCYDDRPGKLFDGLEHIRATILLSHHQEKPGMCDLQTTNLLRWYSECRNGLFPLIQYGPVTSLAIPGSFPKIGDSGLRHIVEKVRTTKRTLEFVSSPNSSKVVYYYRSPLYWIRSMDFLPHFDSGSASRSVHHFKDFGLTDRKYGPVVGSVINSTVFYIWFIAYGNGRNVALRDIVTFPAPETLFSDSSIVEFDKLFKELMADYRRNSVVKERSDGVEYQEFYPAASKPIMDKIDVALARHYGFSGDELDFILNYDIKFRLGRDIEGGNDE
jgi:hypothetical protein